MRLSGIVHLWVATSSTKLLKQRHPRAAGLAGLCEPSSSSIGKQSWTSVQATAAATHRLGAEIQLYTCRAPLRWRSARRGAAAASWAVLPRKAERCSCCADMQLADVIIVAFAILLL